MRGAFTDGILGVTLPSRVFSFWGSMRLGKTVAIFVVLLYWLAFVGAAYAESPVERYGALSVKGNKIVDQHQQPVSLAGPSLFWSNNRWRGEDFYTPESVEYALREWNAGIIRVAMGVEDNGGYLEHPESNWKKASRVLDAAIDTGLYVLMDWHSHHAEENTDAAVSFFQKVAKQYGHHPNLIYEIYNEPLDDADWSKDIKPYAETVIAAIREIDPDNLIVVGTPTWSQDVDKAAKDPISGYDNIAYTLHFYAGTHGEELRDKAEFALSKGIALMVTEWGTVNANGRGAVAYKEVDKWVAFMRKHDLTHCNWALNDKKEGASILKHRAKTHGQWRESDLTESGRYAKSISVNWSPVRFTSRRTVE